MEFPRFDGQDIFSWLYWCEKFFQHDLTLEAEKVKMASHYLDDETYFQWHCTLNKRLQGCLPNWKEYIIMLQDYFGVHFKRPITDLIRLLQRRSLSDFNVEWDLVIENFNLPEDV